MVWQINRDVGPVTWLAPGPAAGLATLQSFVETRLKDFGDKRNDPNNDCLSNLSPYLHFGQVRRLPVVVSHSSSVHPLLSSPDVVWTAVGTARGADGPCRQAPRLQVSEPSSVFVGLASCPSTHPFRMRPHLTPPWCVAVPTRSWRRAWCAASCRTTSASTTPSTTPWRAATTGRRCGCFSLASFTLLQWKAMQALTQPLSPPGFPPPARVRPPADRVHRRGIGRRAYPRRLVERGPVAGAPRERRPAVPDEPLSLSPLSHTSLSLTSLPHRSPRPPPLRR